MKNTWTVDAYTAQYDDAITPRIELQIGDTVKFPMDATPDGREQDAFFRRLSDVNGAIDFSHSDAGWDYFDIIDFDGE